MLNQLGDELRPLGAAKGLDFRMVRTDTKVASDATYLRRILQNLISNAVRYTSRGKVLVGVRHLKNSVRVEVWDTGPGIPEEEQHRIFGEFQRINATASAADGMGLGLAIVERACALLQHPLQLRSVVGRGTLFSVDLPRAQPQSQPSPEAVFRHHVHPRDFSNMVVLLIENDDELRNAMSITMEQWSVDVLTTSSCDEAVELLNEIDIIPDAIVADYQLDDGKDGLSAIQRLRSVCGPIPACIISANRSPDLVRACAAGQLPLLYKPIDPPSLREFLQRSNMANVPKVTGTTRPIGRG